VILKYIYGFPLSVDLSCLSIFLPFSFLFFLFDTHGLWDPVGGVYIYRHPKSQPISHPTYVSQRDGVHWLSFPPYSRQDFPIFWLAVFSCFFVSSFLCDSLFYCDVTLFDHFILFLYLGRSFFRSLFLKSHQKMSSSCRASPSVLFLLRKCVFGLVRWGYHKHVFLFSLGLTFLITF
jgi:hypothetical protein